jgi:hypothetical protein
MGIRWLAKTKSGRCLLIRNILKKHR